MTEDLNTARANAEAARLKLKGTASAVKAGTAPSALMGIVKDVAKARAIKFAVGSLLATRRNPKIALGVAVASALYAFRKPLIDALRQRSKPENDHE